MPSPRLGLLHFPMCYCFLTEIPPKIPARFARRIASFPYVLQLFTLNTPKITARFARQIASFSYVLLIFTLNTPKMPRRALRAGLLHFTPFLLFLP